MARPVGTPKPQRGNTAVVPSVRVGSACKQGLDQAPVAPFDPARRRSTYSDVPFVVAPPYILRSPPPYGILSSCPKPKPKKNPPPAKPAPPTWPPSPPG